MANEISAVVGLSGLKNGVQINTGVQSKQIEMAGVDMVYQTISVSAAGTTKIYDPTQDAPLASAGQLFVKNTDAADTITLSLVSGCATQIFDVIKPGECTLIHPLTVTIYGKSADETSSPAIRAIIET